MWHKRKATTTTTTNTITEICNSLIFLLARRSKSIFMCWVKVFAKRSTKINDWRQNSSSSSSNNGGRRRQTERWKKARAMQNNNEIVVQSTKKCLVCAASARWWFLQYYKIKFFSFASLLLLATFLFHSLPLPLSFFLSDVDVFIIPTIPTIWIFVIVYLYLRSSFMKKTKLFYYYRSHFCYSFSPPLARSVSLGARQTYFTIFHLSIFFLRLLLSSSFSVDVPTTMPIREWMTFRKFCRFTFILPKLA